MSRQSVQACALVLSSCLLWLSPSAGEATEPERKSSSAVARPVEFDRDVQPILAKHCIRCHGSDRAESGLRLHHRASAMKGGDRGAVIEVRNSGKSPLIHRRASEDDDQRMPPKGEGERLSAEQIAVLRAWIDAGANWPDEAAGTLKQTEHWAFKKPLRPAVPAVQTTAWPRNDLDRFVLARLEAEGLRPSPEADRYTLVRRLSLDLIGIPPTPTEVQEFVRDARSDAYEQLIERLLASPHYGERWARMWLDLARYADSAGYGSDPLRMNIWPYRDWAIDAFNRGLPFDQFTIEQIAGDLLPNPTPDQILATAFHRNTMANYEGGTDDEEFRVAAVKDRANVTAQVWMGLTMGCAQCHSHKYDPISQREYYQFYAFFNQAEDSDKFPEEVPLASIIPPSRQRVRPELERRFAEVRRRMNDPDLQISQRQAQWKASLCDQLPKSIQRFLAACTGRRSRMQMALTSAVYRLVAPELKDLRQEWMQLSKELAATGSVETPILRELPSDQRRSTHVLQRGNFLIPGERVEPAVLSAFQPLAKDAPLNRLGLARWLVDRENPLTARVMVNRFWSQLFGRGIVETEEDFGAKGALPSHAELLDWLAVEYMARGWDTKELLRLIVTSATYRQSSRVPPELVAKDPRNRLLARAPRFRLEAEMVRDQALAISGLLSHKVGGPSVYPPQPDGLWRTAFDISRSWPTSTGGDRYRRGLYTFWRRTVPYPSMSTFDAPSRETCTLRRVRTNTPLQAFVTLNDPVYVEAAQALARRIVHEGGDVLVDRARFALQLCLCRPPGDDQVTVVLDLLNTELQHYATDAEAACKLTGNAPGAPPQLASAELAAWTVVANVLLNHDAVLTRN